MKFYKE